MMAAAAHRYYQALAKPTTRKFAVLVGIDQYPSDVWGNAVSSKSRFAGCVTDVQLQQELLIHRFGFARDNIVALLNEAATRQAIEESCLNHLVEQVQPGDVVVFHFSGLGSQVNVFSDEPDGISQLKNSLVPVDGILPTDINAAASSGERPVLNDVMEDTLLLLLRSLPTEHVVTCLDVSFGAPKALLNSSLKLRSRVSIPQGYLSDDERALQTRLLKRNRGKKEIIGASPFPGLLLTAAPSSQGAFEGQWNGFSAGLFTYALTQQFWWLVPNESLATGISLAGAKVEQVVGNQHQPQLSGQKSDRLALETHKFQPLQPASADGAVISFNRETATAQIFMGGVPATILENYGVMSLLQLVDPDGKPQASLAAIAPANTTPDTTSASKTLQTRVKQTDASSPIREAEVTSDTPSSMDTHPEGTQSIPQTFAPQGSQPSVSQQIPTDPQFLTDQASLARQSSSSEAYSETLSEARPETLSEELMVQVRLRDGLIVRAKPLRSQQDAARISRGQLAYERIRVLSKNINLVVALDSQLERIERVDATSALSGIARMASVVAGEQPADILFSKAKSSASPSSSSSSDNNSDGPGGTSKSESRPVEGKGYGLFYLSGKPIQNTTESTEEAVKTAVNRLAPKLRNLLALKLLRLTDNQGSSQLGVRATLELLAPQERILIQQTTFRSPWEPPDNRLAKLFSGDGAVPSLAVGSTIRYRLQNYSDRPVYCVLLGLDARGNAIAISPSIAVPKGSGETPTATESIILPGDILTLPQANQSSEWVVGGPVGLADTFIETYAVFSREPLKRTTDAISKEMRPMGNFRQLSLLSNPMEVVQALLADLNEASRKGMIPGADISSDAYALNMQSYASLSFVYRVV